MHATELVALSGFNNSSIAESNWHFVYSTICQVEPCQGLKYNTAQ